MESMSLHKRIQPKSEALDYVVVETNVVLELLLQVPVQIQKELAHAWLPQVVANAYVESFRCEFSVVKKRWNMRLTGVLKPILKEYSITEEQTTSLMCHKVRVNPEVSKVAIF
jgi:hypothetical protein